MGAAAVVLVRQRQRELVDRFLAASAVTPETARTLDDLMVQRGLMFNRMAAQGVLVANPDGRWYFSQDAWVRFEDRRWKRLNRVALIIVVLAAITFVVLLMR